jgi:hypothetical protein
MLPEERWMPILDCPANLTTAVLAWNTQILAGSALGKATYLALHLILMAALYHWNEVIGQGAFNSLAKKISG